LKTKSKLKGASSSPERELKEMESKEVLYKFYGEDQVEIFIDWIRRYQDKGKIEMFFRYHTEQVMLTFMKLFPPPGLMEVWNRWNSLPSKKQKAYCKPF